MVKNTILQDMIDINILLIITLLSRKRLWKIFTSFTVYVVSETLVVYSWPEELDIIQIMKSFIPTAALFTMSFETHGVVLKAFLTTPIRLEWKL